MREAGGPAPIIIGIGGGAASGKTTLARALQHARPGTALISLDDFFLQHRTHGPFITVAGERHFDLNHPGAIDVPAVINAIEGRRQQSVILLEGHLALAIPELRERMNLKVYVHVADDLRLGRKIVRNHEQRSQAPSVTFQNYLNSGKAGHEAFIAPSMKEADILLDGMKPIRENVSLLLKRMEEFTSGTG